MNKYISYSILLSLFLFGCTDFLDKRDPTATTFVEFFNNEEDLRRVIYSSYLDVFSNPQAQSLIFYMDEGKSDNAYSRVQGYNHQVIANGNFNSNTTTFLYYYELYMKHLGRLNTFIANSDVPYLEDESVRAKYKSILEGLRVWHYFRLTSRWGAVPFHLEPADLVSALQPVTPKEEILDELFPLAESIANKLHLSVGDRFTCYFVQDPVRARRFDIVGIYETNFEDWDKLFIITDKEILGNLNDWDEDLVSGIEVLVNDYNNLDITTQNLFFQMSSYNDRLGNALYTRSIKDINPMIFNWLSLLDMNVWVIITLMLIVSGFTMISGLLIIILERTNMIGMLKSMGASDFSIRKVFLYLSAFLIGRGMLWGNIIALLFCVLQDRFKILKLDPSTYYLSAVPVDLNPLFIILLNVGTLIVSLIMMIGPSYLVAKITPSKSIRFE